MRKPITGNRTFALIFDTIVESVDDIQDVNFTARDADSLCFRVSQIPPHEMIISLLNLTLGKHTYLSNQESLPRLETSKLPTAPTPGGWWGTWVAPRVLYATQLPYARGKSLKTLIPLIMYSIFFKVILNLSYISHFEKKVRLLQISEICDNFQFFFLRNFATLTLMKSVRKKSFTLILCGLEFWAVKVAKFEFLAFLHELALSATFETALQFRKL